MEIETINEDAKKVIVGLLNKTSEIEYGFVWNYPRIIDQIVNIHNIHDEQLIRDLEDIGKQSLKHFSDIDNTVVLFGGEPKWQLMTIERIANVEGLLAQQLEKEREVASVYKKIRQVVRQNRMKVKVNGLLAKFHEAYGELPERAKNINANDIISMLDRHIAEEERHAKLLEDAIYTFKMLMNKKAE